MLQECHFTSVQAAYCLEVWGVCLFKWTVIRRLRKCGLTACRPVSGPQLTREHWIVRLHFGREHLHWMLEQWSYVLFTDEARFILRAPDGQTRVWRRRGERFAECNFVQPSPYQGRLWCGVRFPLINIPKWWWPVEGHWRMPDILKPSWCAPDYECRWWKCKFHAA